MAPRGSFESYLDLEQPFSRIPDVDNYGQGKQCLLLTIMSDKNESLEAFGYLLDDGGETIKNVNEPDDSEIHDDDGIKGENIPKHTVAPESVVILGEDDRLEIGIFIVTEYSLLKNLRTIAIFLKMIFPDSRESFNI